MPDRLTVDTALDALRAAGDPGVAAEQAAYHKTSRAFFGVRVPVIDDMARGWRQRISLPARLELAAGLWDSDVHEGRVAAAKLLTQARIRPDDSGAWALIVDWAEGFDSWALADHACAAGARRLVADPARVDVVADWTLHPNLWTRRAALVITLPWARLNHPSAHDTAIRERVLDWAATYVPDRDWFIQKAIATWLRELSKHDRARSTAFLEAHGAAMKPFAAREAAAHLTDRPEKPPLP
ncbi:DNA alkylation repair protein [Roseicitreum antarcticum]|uniref:3-methyladenine DNA glycosylase AlkD n=1 Tax=Roseicitreum antarcticum TaxID=564137 RepID=A0A1H3CET8_9RHOB|nr:DNA alkylation repair protein [Roseicitreum antarcticum]SDX52009.1 3-methyladenine DNA glycosylase AlkD [Roseicitreum antarcticum]